MLYLKEGDLYKNVRILAGTSKSPFYGDVYILRRGDKEDTWTLSSYDEETGKICEGSNYISDISYDDMLLSLISFMLKLRSWNIKFNIFLDVSSYVSHILVNI